ncbi:MAG TPA: hypothetical protein VE442_00665 [Jatrophihabitans sp.]|nr:hypothetical protein [Jatrophihabitans sp.]
MEPFGAYPFDPAALSAQSTGYRVAPADLHRQAETLTSEADALERLLTAVTGVSVPAAAFGAIPQSAQAAAELTDRLRAIGREIDSAVQTTRSLSGKVTDAVVGYVAADNAVADSYRRLVPDAALPQRNAQAAPAATGPFATQIAQNRTLVATALGSEQQRLAQLLRQQARTGGSQLDGQVVAAENRIALYQDILARNRQIVAFDPSGNGRIVEQIGTIDQNTGHIGVLVPGTFSSIANHETYAHTAQDMVAAAPGHDLAMLVYSDGRNPQGLGLDGAAQPTYAQAMAPDLAAFSHDLRGAAGAAPITYLGHSYAASTLGAAEQRGLDADQIVRVEGAGEGPGIWRPADLPDTGRVANYSMTAADDPIALIQADSAAYPIVDGAKIALGLPPNAIVPAVSPHGADPDTFPGTVDLDPGYVPHNPLLPGVDVREHTAVLEPYSPSWWNLFKVVDGQQPTTLPAH